MRRPVLLALLAGALAIAGCGSDKAEEALLARANRICVHAQQRTDAMTGPTKVVPQFGAERFFNRLRAIADPAMARLRALKAPVGLHDDWTAFIAAQQRYVSLVDALPAEAAANSPRLKRDLRRSDGLLRASNAAAKAVGATRCAED